MEVGAEAQATANTTAEAEATANAGAEADAEAEAEPQVKAIVEAEVGKMARAIRQTSWWKKSPVAPTALLSWPRLGGTPGRKLGRSESPFPTKSLWCGSPGVGAAGLPWSDRWPEGGSARLRESWKNPGPRVPGPTPRPYGVTTLKITLKIVFYCI